MRHTPTLEFVLDALPETRRHIEDLLAQARRVDAEVAARRRRRRLRRRPRPLPAAGRRGRRGRRRPERRRLEPAGADGIVVVDKPAGLTSHDVVARVRRLAGTRRVGHAGTLDPMATGVLCVGIGRATRLLGHLAGRQGVRRHHPAGRGDHHRRRRGRGGGRRRRRRRLTDDEVDGRGGPLSGRIEQVPSAVSAIKVDGQRALRARPAGEDVELAARPVTVDRVRRLRRASGVDGRHRRRRPVDCSTGTYVRALARDLGAALGVGGHLTMLRRTQVGPVGEQRAHRLDDWPSSPRTTCPT